MSPAAPPPAPATPELNHTLPIGTMVGGLQITGLIGEGGFGIVYLAFDTTLQRQVALKEYMPSSLAARNVNSADISVKSAKFVDTFNAGLRSFVNEARLLAHFDHPALVKVHQFWQANNTAYMVMPYYQGPTLKAHVATMRAASQKPDEAMLRGWLDPLLDALATMHAEQCFHRDIAPDNILLTNRGPLLLDLGAARRVIGDMTQALTVILKPGYAPIEQYGDVATMLQGPWTDLYALASVVYFCISGHSPITSVERVMGDPLPRLARSFAGQYSDTFLTAMDAALAVRPADRPQSVAELRALLAGTAKPRPPAEPAAAPVAPPPVVPPAYALDRTQALPPTEKGAYAPTVAMPGSPAKAGPMAAPTVAAAAAAPEATAPSRRGLWIAVLGGVAGAAVAAALLLPRGTTRPAVPEGAAAGGAPAATAASAVATTPPAPAPAASAAPTAAAPVVTRPAAAAPAVAAPAPPVAVPAPPPRRTVAASAPVARAPRPAPRPAEVIARPVPEAPPRVSTPPPPVPSTSEKPVQPAATPAPPARAAPAMPARCTELLQKGSQGLLTMDEANFLRKECR